MTQPCISIFLDNPNNEVPISVPGDLSLEKFIAAIRNAKEIPKIVNGNLLFSGRNINTDGKLRREMEMEGAGQPGDPFHVVHNVEKTLEWQAQAGG